MSYVLLFPILAYCLPCLVMPTVLLLPCCSAVISPPAGATPSHANLPSQSFSTGSVLQFSVAVFQYSALCTVPDSLGQAVNGCSAIISFLLCNFEVSPGPRIK